MKDSPHKVWINAELVHIVTFSHKMAGQNRPAVVICRGGADLDATEVEGVRALSMQLAPHPLN